MFKKHRQDCEHSYTVLQIKASQWSITPNPWLLTTYFYHIMTIVTGGFSKKSFFIIFRSSHMQMFFKTMSQSVFNVVEGRQATLFQLHCKKDLNTGDSCENCKFTSCFYGIPPVTAFASLIM